MTIADQSFSVLYTQVREFYSRQMHLLDRCEAQRWAATFVEDGVFELGEGLVRRGTEQLIRFIDDARADLNKREMTMRHWFGMLAMSLQSDGSVATRSYVLVFEIPVDGEAPVLRMSTVCEDMLVVGIGNELRVRRRRVTNNGSRVPRAVHRSGGWSGDGE